MTEAAAAGPEAPQSTLRRVAVAALAASTLEWYDLHLRHRRGARCVQGVAIGGQYGGAVLLVTENAPAHRRGFHGSLAQMGPSLALILSNVVFLVVVAVLSPEAFASWGRRIPFLLSVVVIGIGLHIQLRLEDTAAPDPRHRAGDPHAPHAAVAGVLTLVAIRTTAESYRPPA